MTTTTRTITGVIRGGRIEADGPIDWPDGTVVRVAVTASDAVPPSTMSDAEREAWKREREEERDRERTTPEGIARVLAAMDAMQPLDMSDQELADWEADRLARKAWELEHFN